MPDLVDFPFDCETIQSWKRKTQEQTYSAVEQKKRVAKRFLDLFLASSHRCRVRYAPVSRHWLARPDRTNLFGGIVTNREYKIELRSARLSKLVPFLAPETIRVKVGLLKLAQCFRSNFSSGMTACAISSECRLAFMVEVASAIIDRAEFPVHRKRTLYRPCISVPQLQQLGPQQDVSG